MNNTVCFVMKIEENYGGAERRFARLIKFMSDRGEKFYLVLVGENRILDNFIKDYSLQGIEILCTRSLFSVYKKMKRKDIGKIHFVTINTSFLFLYKALRYIKGNKEVILSLNSYNLCLGDYKNKLQRYVFKELIKSVDKIDCLYPLYLENVKKITENINRSITITAPINSFTDLEKFKPAYEKEKKIVFASRLINQKNPILALEAIKESSNLISENEFQVIIAGDGPLYPTLKNYIEENKLRNIVKLLGRVDLEDILPMSRIFISIQDTENYPSQSLLEAIATGNFVIASNVGDTKRIVKNNFGVLTELNKADLIKSLNKAIEKTNDDKKMNNIIRNSRDFAVNNFKISNYADHLKRVWNGKN